MNPYSSPQSSDLPPPSTGGTPAVLHASRQAMAARYIAAVMDSVLAAIVTVLAAKSLPEHWLVAQVIFAAVIYVGYYLAGEAILARTPGKYVTGLWVVREDGRRCTPWQALVRTLFRLVEANPLLLGALPAALSIVFSRTQQRWGDRAAGTFVIRARSVPG